MCLSLSPLSLLSLAHMEWDSHFQNSGSHNNQAGTVVCEKQHGHTCAHAYMFARVGIHVCTYVHKDSTPTFTYTHVHSHAYIAMHSQIHTCICIYLHSHRCIPPYAYKSTCIHTQNTYKHTACCQLCFIYKKHRVRALSQQRWYQDGTGILLASHKDR